MTEVTENLQASAMTVTDQETGEILDNGNIQDGTKIKIELEVSVTDEISGEDIEVKLRDNKGDYTSYLTVTGTDLINKKADIEILLDTAEIIGDQYILDISYGEETLSKIIETPLEFCYTVNADGTITIVEYTGSSKEIVIPGKYEGYTVSTIGEAVFVGSNLEKVVIEDGVTTIKKNAFNNCQKLKVLVLPRTLKTIGDAAFLACPLLEEIIIPRSVTTTGLGILQKCTNLKRVVIFKETSSIGKVMLASSGNAVIYCEDNSPALTYATTNNYPYVIITENYNITYNSNAGTDTVTNMPSTQNKVKYDTITMSTNIPERTGYNFLGWSTSSTSTEIEYLPGDDYRTDANLDLYAVWDSLDKDLSYTVEYYKDNVKQDADTETIKVTVKYDQPDTITVDKTKINTENKYEGYRFVKTEPTPIPDTVNSGDVIKVYYALKNYNISYNLDGGKLKDGETNLSSFTINDSFTLKNPVKEGYTFIGWTGSNGTTPEMTVKIEKGTAENKIYYANYKINTYTVTYKVDGEIYGEVESYEYGENIVKRAAPEKYGYKFSGWSEIPETMPAQNIEITGTFSIDESLTKELNYTVEYYKDNVKQDSDTQNEKTTVQVLKPETITVDKTKINTEDKYLGYTFEKTEPAEIPDLVDSGTIIKVYYTINEYNITYNLNGGSLESGKTNPSKYTVNDSITLNNPSKKGNTFTGWTGSNGEEPQKTVKIEGQTGNKDYTANYTTNFYKLTIKYNHNKGDEYAKEYVQEYQYGKAYSVKSPVIPGYTASIKTVSGRMSDQDVVVEVNYTANENTKYVAKHYKQNIEDSNFTLAETENYTGTTDRYTTVNCKDYDGFVATIYDQEIIAGDGSTVVEIYYTRNSYMITYKVDGEVYGEKDVYKYEQTIVPRTAPEKYGYIFSGWSEIPETMPAQNIEITGTFSIDTTKVKELSYRVEYYKSTERQDSDTEVEKTVVHILDSDQIAVDKSKINTENKYIGYRFVKTEPAEIPDVVNSGDVIKVYYALKNYNIAYDLNGGKLKDGETNVRSFTIEDSFTLNNPEKEGYTFIGWTGANGETPQKNVTIEKGTIGNRSYEANYEINTYTVTYKVDGKIYGEVESYEYGKDIVKRAVPEKYGYKFSGWSEIPETMPAHDVVIEGTFTIDESLTKDLIYIVEYYKNNVKQDADTITDKVTVQVLRPNTINVDKTKINTKDKYEGYTFEKTEPSEVPDSVESGTIIKVYYSIEEYSVNYDLDGGNLTNGSNPEKYTILDEFTLNNPEKEGYTFIGWTGSNGTTPEMTVKIEKGTSGNKEYKANFVANTDTKYKVEYYKENLDNDEYSVFETEERTGTTDTLTAITAEEKEGFTIKEIEQQNIAGNGGAIVKVYYERNRYKLTYYTQEVGEPNVYIDSITYKYEEKIISIGDVEKYGYKFSGWIDIPETMPAHDVEVNGYLYIDENQTKDLSYTIEYYKDNVKQDVDTVTEKATVHVLESDQIAVDKTKINTENKYKGFAFEKMEPEEVLDTVKTGTVIRIYYNIEKYNISYDLAGGNLTSGINPETYTIEDEVVLKAPEKEGYTFIGWTGSNGEEPQKDVKIEKGTTGNKEFKANYTINTYTIEYDLGGGSLSEGKTNPETYTIEDVFALNNPKKDGFRFVGWTGSNGEVPNKNILINKTTGNRTYVANYSARTYKLIINYFHNNGDKYPIQHIASLGTGETYNVVTPIVPGYVSNLDIASGIMGNEDVFIDVRYTANTDTKYTIEHYKQNIADDEYTLAETENAEGTTDTETKAVSKEYIGFTAKEIKQEYIEGDGSTIVKIYYDRNEYTVTYKVDGETEKVETYRFEESIPQREMLEKEGYKFSGWSELPETMPAENLEATGTFTIDEEKTKELNYKLEYYKNNVKQEEDTEEEKITVQVLSSDTISVDKTKINLDNKYEGYVFEKTEPKEIPDSVESGTIIKVYYIPENYSITYDLAGGNLTSGINPETYTIEDEVVLKAPEKEGYTFIGWTGSNGNEIQKDVKIEKGSMGDKEYKANYTVNTYTLTYKVDGEQYGEVESYEFGQSINPKEAPVKAGYKFSGWIEIPETMPARDVEIKGTFSIDEEQQKEIKYTIEYYKNNEKQEKDTVIESAIVFEFDNDNLNVDKTKINTQDKYVGYAFVKTEPKEIPDTVENGTVIKVYYEANKDTKYVVEHYKQNIDNDDYTMFEKEDCVGTTDTMTAAIEKEYIGYYSKEFTQENIDANEATTIKIYYDRKDAKLNIEFRDFISGEEISEKLVKTAKVFDKYDISKEQVNIEGYTLVDIPKELTGEYTEEEQTKVYKFAKNSKVTVNYIDKISNENILDSIVIDGYETKEYKTEEKDIENYILVETEGNVQGNMTKENIVVNYYYIAVSQGVIEKHIDIITNEILDSKVHEGNEGDTYKVEPKDIEGFKVVEEKLPTNAEGKMTKETIVVEYFYVRNTSLKVQYIDKVSNEVFYEDVKANSEGDSYTTEEKEFDGYELVEKPENASGKMIVTKEENNIKTETTVKYYYKKISAGVVVRYYDIDDNTLLGEDKLSGLEGDSYKVEPKDIKGFELVKEHLPTNSEGVMTIAEIEVKYFYRKVETITSEEYIINEDDIKKIVMNTSIEDFVENINIKEDYTILDHEGNAVSKDEIIKTGMKLKLEDGKEYDLIVRGDINCDGRVSLVDLSKILLHYNGMKGFMLEGCPCKAADMNYDDRVSLIDISQMLVFYNSI